MEESPDGYAKLQAAFEAARQVPAAQRNEILEEACDGDEELRAEVLALLGGVDAHEPALLSDEGISSARKRVEGIFGDELASGSGVQDAPAWQPERIGEYRVVRRLGEGGMGIVFEAEQSSPRRRVALKLLHPQRTSPSSLRRLKHEAELLGRLQHPGIARIYESGTFDAGHGPQPFFAMELVEGVDLRAYAEQARLDARAVLGLMAQVAEAVHHAHRRGVIHRDLKPENVLVDGRGQPFVLDFGIARASEGTDALSTFQTREGMIMGTLAYMAPEQLTGNLKAISPRTDVYALGVMAFELLAGRLPHQVAGLDLPAALKVLQEDSPRSLSGLNRTLAGDVETIVTRAMSREPERRFGTAEALAGDLRRYLDGNPIASRPPSRAYLARKFVARHRAPVVGTALVLLALLAGLTVSVSQYLRAQRSAKLADQRYEEVTQLADLKRLADARIEAEKLWPPVPQLAPAMGEWLERRAAPLRENLKLHRATLERIRRGAHVDGFVDGQERWILPTDTAQWQHDALAGLIADLEVFLDRDPFVGTVASVEERLNRALRIEARTITGAEPAERWARALMDIARVPRYGGLQLTPQLGLIPLRRDPQSDLWEFWHVGSGIEPFPGADGTWQIREETGLVLVLMPGGIATLGAQSKTVNEPHFDPLAESNEGPVHTVELGPYFLSKYEMTQGQWQRATGSNPSNYGPDYRWETGSEGGPSAHVNDGTNPVEQVSWADCERTLQHLGLAIPTEAQWEFAARGGSMTPWWCGADARFIGVHQAGNVADDRSRQEGAPAAWPFEAWRDPWIVHAPVGSFAPNPNGLHDTLGNLFEWCADARGSYDLPVEPGTGRRLVPEPAERRIARGGSFGLSAAVARSATRFSYTPAYRNDLVGIRPGRPVEPPPLRSAMR